MQTTVEMVSNGLTLRGMLHKPEHTEHPVPAVLMLHGFSNNKMETGWMFVALSRMLERRGIASLRFDFGGSGESDGDFMDMTISGEVSDAKRILEYAKSLEFVDPERIGVLGMSLGGVVAGILAGKHTQDVQSLCLWAPAFVASEHVRSGRVGEMDITNIKEEGYVQIGFGGLRLGSGFVEDVLQLDIAGLASGYDKPILILQGDRDTAVPLSSTRQFMEHYGGKAKLEIVEGAGHMFERFEHRTMVLERTARFMIEQLGLMQEYE
ncbi:alpha/beta hydrolase family protein [Cohnella sp.]|uniref:alpha/beta hydrolase family protein n=1 Tax=Cohnella sp. TaxID=1883426 RepID=UPI003561B81D